MQDKKVRSLIVEPSDDGAYGIVTETDIAYKIIARDRDPEAIMVYQIMTSPCIVVDPHLSIKDVALLFAETGIIRAPVVRERLLGMISVTDFIAKLELAKQTSSDRLSAKVRQALLHNRVVADEREQIDLECETAWDVVEDS